MIEPMGSVANTPVMSRRMFAWITLVLFLACCVAARLFISRTLDGTLCVGWNRDAAAWRWGAVHSAMCAGAALALSGLLLQSMLRNPLASPFVLGLSAGSQAAVAIAYIIAFQAGAALAPSAQVPIGTLGAVVALLLCIAFGRSRERGLDPIGMVLAGVVVAAMAGSIAALCEWLLPPTERMGLAAWSLGRIPEAPESLPLIACLVLLAVSLLFFQVQARTLDAMQLSDDEALSVGVNLRRMRWAIVIASSALAAAATALCGPLAFVGLVAPHAARALFAGSHRSTLFASAIAGAALLVLADATRTMIPVQGGRLPIGVVCALAGGPAFLVLLRRGAAGAWSR